MSSTPPIYAYVQEIFPDLKEQSLPLDSPEHFGEFFDWINLNDTYLQSIDLHNGDLGLEHNILIQQHNLSYTHFQQHLKSKISQCQNINVMYGENFQLQEVFRLIVWELRAFLLSFDIDLLIILSNEQKYWLAYPLLSAFKRKQLINAFKSNFNDKRPLYVLDPNNLALFYTP